MARTRTISDEQILNAAREVFLEQGIQATTAEIAVRAGVSEGTIFRRYPSKDVLFLASMGLPDVDYLDRLLSSAGEGDLEANLTRLAEVMLSFLEELVPRLVVVASSGMLREVTSDPNSLPPVQLIKTLEAYFSGEMNLGRMRRSDPEVCARIWLGTLHHYAFAEHVGLNDYLPLPRPVFIRGVVSMFLEGAVSKKEHVDG